MAVALVLTAVVVEARVFARGRQPRPRESLVWAAGWLSLAVAVGAGLFVTGDRGSEYATVYALERALSLDNLFLFLLLLGYFGVPQAQRARVLAFGILAAIVLRGLAIVAGVALLDALEQLIYVFGAGLLFVAYRSLVSDGTKANAAQGRLTRALARVVPISDGFRGSRLLVRERGRLYATPLLLSVVAILAADIAFAVDSIPAAFAVTRDWTSIWLANAFALLGMRSLIALVEDLVRRFRYIEKTIACVIAFAGAKILLAPVIELSDKVTVAIIAAVFVAGVGASLVADRLDPPSPRERGQRRPPRCPPSTEVGQLAP
ncbi:MAG: TerC/Alx family metal homeostasis membrane protein [Gaiellaceae bacterium]